jgi:hypothetical protein
MFKSAQSRRGALIKPANHALIASEELRAMAADPALLPACSDYAKRHYPRSALARAA